MRNNQTIPLRFEVLVNLGVMMMMMDTYARLYGALLETEIRLTTDVNAIRNEGSRKGELF